MTVDVITASAGAGKTYTLAEEMLQAIERGSARPDAIVAITYTNKAAAELGRRLRRRLLTAGRPLDAARVRDGYLGTVHSVCQRLIAELAFEAGSSPYPAPAPESYSARLFREVVGEVTHNAVAELGPLVEVLALQGNDKSRSQYGSKSWRDFLEQMVGSARENRLGAAELRASCEHSVRELRDLLAEPRGSADERDQEIFQHVPGVLAWIEDEIAAQLTKKGKATKKALDQQDWANKLARSIERGQKPPWSDLAAVFGDLWSAAKCEPGIGDLRSALADHLSHPRLHAELEELLAQVFDHAAKVGEAFVARKKSERLLDFEDMLAQAADVLSRPEARARLAGRIDLVMVDEFQDTSPVQLEVVLALSSLAERTVWVGDEKQAIFGFQGSDPALMGAAAAASLDGRKPRVLDHNFRSRPPLVRFCSEVFASALEHRGVQREQVVLEPACPEPPTLEGAPALRLWRTTKDPSRPRSKANEALGIARHARRLLRDGAVLVREATSDPTQVAPTRPARPGDIAVLARRNKDCHAIARALEAAGVPARVAEQGLGATPEALILRAGLALLADPRDTLAAAEIAWFTGTVSDPERWLEGRIAASAKAKADRTHDIAFPEVEPLVRLRALAQQARQQTPEEAILTVYDALDLPESALAWADPHRHFANLEALRAVACDYQDTCAARRSAATIAGLVRHLGDLPSEVEQALPTTDDAVRVLTYHKAKGLEWPIVVCATLGETRDPSFFGVRVQPAPSFDIAAPLAGRELRWWPWPYGAKAKGLSLADNAAGTTIATELIERDRAERARLLYVGFTRARDHLVLSAVEAKAGMATSWLDQLVDTTTQPVLDLPWTSDGTQTVVVGGERWDVVVGAEPSAAPTDASSVAHAASWFQRPRHRTERTAQRIRPSSQTLSDAAREQVTIAQVVSLGARQPLGVHAMEMAAAGDAIHGFLAAGPAGEASSRVELAAALLRHHGLTGRIAPQTVIDMADHFHRWLDDYAPGARLPEWPVRWVRDDGRVLNGDIDLLVPYGEGWLLLDHKSTRATTATRDEKLRTWAGQLAAYRAAVEKATGKPVVEVWVHLPVGGEVVRLEIPREG
jgi:ATP-dependent helicase/nuclease subunit A